MTQGRAGGTFAPKSSRAEDAAWKAVVKRDRGEDGRFVYGVRTTGIYCRPSCPSRKPRRENVTFFRTPEDAERAGLRECRRCRPRSTSGSMMDVCVDGARAYLDTRLDGRTTLQQLARHVGVSPFHLQRAFKARFGLSPRAYVRARRLERFKEHTRNGASVTRALYEAGFASPRGLYEGSLTGLGMTPATYRRGGAGMELRHTTVRCSLGKVLVAVTDRGVASVLLGDTEGALEAELGREFPQAIRVRGAAGARPLIEAVVASVDGRASGGDVPLDVRGTDFQRRVWALLQSIPRGETRSYAELAAALGTPSATRAVARACAANKLAVLVPCHRVVRSDGELAGYRWGLGRKRELLERERP